MSTTRDELAEALPSWLRSPTEREGIVNALLPVVERAEKRAAADALDRAAVEAWGAHKMDSLKSRRFTDRAAALRTEADQ